LFTPDGQVLLQCDGFTMHEVQRDFLANGPAAKGARSSPTPAALPPGSGIEPGTGVQLVLDLLGTRAPRHVAVRPFRDGRPAPVAVAQVAAVAAAAAAAEPTASAPARTAPVSAPAAPERAEAPGGADELAGRIHRLWSTALVISDISGSDDFFELGGNSLAAIDLAAMVRKELGVELNIAILFDYPTLSQFTEALRAQGGIRG
jgi:acyl carrier protein